MPQALPIIGSLLGPVLGAFGSSGNQGGNKGTQASTGTSQFGQTQLGTNAYGGTATPTEAPGATAFRQGLFNTYNAALAKGQQPIYGDAQKAAFINQANQQTNAGSDALKQRLAASGSLISGLGSQAQTQLELGRQGNITNFLSQLPFQERQAQMSQLNPLLQGAGALAGRAPVGSITSGANTSNVNTAGTNQTANQTNFTNQIQGPGFLQSLLSGFAGALGGKQGASGSNPFNWLSNLFGGNPASNNPNVNISGGNYAMPNIPIGPGFTQPFNY